MRPAVARLQCNVRGTVPITREILARVTPAGIEGRVSSGRFCLPINRKFHAEGWSSVRFGKGV